MASRRIWTMLVGLWFAKVASGQRPEPRQLSPRGFAAVRVEKGVRKMVRREKRRVEVYMLVWAEWGWLAE